MLLKRILKQWPVILFFGFFGWFLYKAVTYNNYYHGGPLKRFTVVIKDKPYYFWTSDSPTSYYSFTIQNKRAKFRISEGAPRLIKKNKIIRRQIDSIQSGDSIDLEIRPEEYKKLNNEFGRIRVIGLYKGGRTIIEPAVVRTMDMDEKGDKIFGLCVALILLIILIRWAYLKEKKQNRISSITSE